MIYNVLATLCDAQHLTNCVFYIGVVDTRDGGKPTDVKERNRQRARERYAQMDKEKKDERNKKRREAYQQKKSQTSVNTRQPKNSPSVLSQLQSTPVVTGAF